jgi:acetyl-CoA carboxylase alpha subunit
MIKRLSRALGDEIDALHRLTPGELRKERRDFFLKLGRG